MKIEKIKNYNQVMLAVLVTIGILIALFILVVVISEAVRNINWAYNDDRETTGILAEEKTAELVQNNQRKQIISYDEIRLVDTTNNIYIIPVKPLNIKEAEDTRAFKGLLNMSSSKSYSDNYYKTTNTNLLIYDAKNNNTKMLFDKRIVFGYVHANYFNDDILLTFYAAENDTNKDGVVNLNDQTGLYIYSLKAQQLDYTSLPDCDVREYTFVNQSKDLFISFAFDKNQDGKFDKSTEPYLLKRYNYERRTLEDIIPPYMEQNMQKLLEGSNIN